MEEKAGEDRYTLMPGAGGLPVVSLAAPDGARAVVSLYGGQILSWIPVRGEERLFLSKTAEFHPGAAIRGGIPVIFPQFSTLGPLVKHGFARLLPWELAGVEAAPEGKTVARLELRDSESTRQTWPYTFALELELTLGGMELEIRLKATNTGQQPFRFTCALHTYLRIDDIGETVVEGLAGVRYLEGKDEAVQQSAELSFPGEVDRVYIHPPEQVRVRERDRRMQISTRGFPDLVVWNPGAERGSALSDLETDGYRHMLCIEAAAVDRPVWLAARESWAGLEILSA